MTEWRRSEDYQSTPTVTTTEDRLCAETVGHENCHATEVRMLSRDRVG